MVAVSNIFGMFTPNFGEDEPILTIIFFKWVGKNHQLGIIHDWVYKIGVEKPDLGGKILSNWVYIYIYMYKSLLNWVDDYLLSFFGNHIP